MSTYKEIRGFSIENFTTDPPNASVGQVWYNDTTGQINYNSGNLSSAWATGNNMGSARYNLAGDGTQTAAIAMGGFSQPGDTTENKVELYNGSSWTAAPVLPTGQWDLCGSGIQTSALAYGGDSPRELTMSWNGTAWTAGPGQMNINQQRSGTYGRGESNASAIIFGGPPSSASDGYAEVFSQGEWGTIPRLNTSRDQIGGCGTAASTLAFGGDSGSYNAVEEWNNTSWVTKSPLTTGRRKPVGGGVATLGTAMGGYTGPSTASAATEVWNGTAWTNAPNMNTARKYMAGGGATSSSCIAFGGQVTPNTSGPGATEKFTSSGGVKTVARA
jgi:hypothetical protein